MVEGSDGVLDGENWVRCNRCGKPHKPVREFWNSNGYYVCGWDCIAFDIFERHYGKKHPEEIRLLKYS